MISIRSAAYRVGATTVALRIFDQMEHPIAVFDDLKILTLVALMRSSPGVL